MAQSKEEIVVKVNGVKEAKGEVESLGRTFDETGHKIQRHAGFTDQVTRSTDHATRAFGRLRAAAGYAGGLFGITAVGYGVRDVFKSGLESQENQRLLLNAIHNTGQHGTKAQATLEGLNKQTDKTATRGGFDSTEQQQQLLRFINQTHSATKAVEDNNIAMGLARGQHMSYASAVSLVTRAETGSVGRLRQYVKNLTPVTYFLDKLTAKEKKLYPERKKKAEQEDREATAASARVLLQQQYANSLQTYSKTAQGAVTNANNAFKAAITELGEKLLPTITKVANAFREVVEEARKGEGVWKTVGHDITAVWNALKELAKWVAKNKTLVLELGKILVAALAVEKILRFVSAFKKLLIVQTVVAAFSRFGPAAAEGATAIEGEAAAYTAAGSLLGEALVAGIVGYVATKLAKELADKVHISFHIGNILQGKSPFSVSVDQGEIHNPYESQNRTNEAKYHEEVLNHPYRTAHAELAGPLGKNDPIIEAFHKRFETHVHVHLDGKQVAHSVVKHVKNDKVLSRKLSEANTMHVLERGARGHN